MTSKDVDDLININRGIILGIVNYYMANTTAPYRVPVACIRAAQNKKPMTKTLSYKTNFNKVRFPRMFFWGPRH